MNTKSYPTHWQRQTLRERLVQWLWLAGIAFATAWAISFLDIEWTYLADAHEQAADLAMRMWPPSGSYLPYIIQPLIETIHIATLGTSIAVIIAIPVAFMAARNTATHSLIWLTGRAILVLSRSINTVIWGLLFVAIFGPGALAGICAVAARSIGFVAKIVAEAIEEVDHGQVEAIEATGASTLQTYFAGIVPQILPVLIGTSIFRWDINIRESSVLGFVGAGGIGLPLYASINNFEWNQVLTVLLVILMVVIASEAISARVRSSIS